MGLQVGIGFSSKNNTMIITDVDTKESMRIGAFTGGHISQEGVFNANGNNYEKPIPPGSYYITEYPNPDRPNNNHWYGLLKIDEKIDDETIDQYGNKRFGFRLHPGTVSHGCVTISSFDQQGRESWGKLKEMLDKTSTSTIEYEDKWYRKNRQLKLYGILHVK